MALEDVIVCALRRYHELGQQCINKGGGGGRRMSACAETGANGAGRRVATTGLMLLARFDLGFG